MLQNFSLSLRAGEKVAVCGHSGSGKTSLILTLLHMIDFEGSVKIDGVEISGLDRVGLRSRLNVVPQDPFLMPGSLRFNIDPYQSASDETITAALRRLGLWDKIQACGGLDEQKPSDAWSVGERQLLCMARAMVRKSPVLILDEATSRFVPPGSRCPSKESALTWHPTSRSVDSATEAIMQDVIQSDFAAQTVVAVVHRLGHIRRFDKIAVLQRGRLAEFDTPDALLARDSLLASMYKAGGYEAAQS